MTDFREIDLGEGQGVIKGVRVSFHSGSVKRAIWPKNHILETGHRFYNFWSSVEGRKEGTSKIIHHYGLGYVLEEDVPAVNEQVIKAKQAVAQAAEKVAQAHP